MNEIKYPIRGNKLTVNALHSTYYFVMLVLIFGGILFGVVTNLPSKLDALHYILIAAVGIVLGVSCYFLAYWFVQYRTYKKESF